MMIEYVKNVLANGLRVISVEMPHLHSAEMVCYVGVGSRYECSEKRVFPISWSMCFFAVPETMIRV